MKFIAVLGLLCATLPFSVSAQQDVGITGACMIETAAGEAINVSTCRRMPAQCTPVACEVPFLWMNSGSSTMITMPHADAMVGEGVAMNGQEAYAPAALRDSDPRDCIYNAVSDAVFCWVPGVEAFTAAIGLQSRDDLIAIAAASPASGGDNDMAALLRPLQGKYIPFPDWSCDVTGGEGGALAIIGDVFYGVESECRLSNGRAVGAHGAAIFDVMCSGEGDTWADEYILRRDEWGRLGWMSADQVSVMESCE